MATQNVSFAVTKITIMETDGTDVVVFKIEGSSPYPSWMPDYQPEIKIECAKGHAYNWLCENVPTLNLEDVCVVNCRARKV